MTTKKIITEEEFYNHDCHASPEDGCETCALWEEQQKAKEGECELCHGTGVIIEPAHQAYSESRGTYIEDEQERECPHVTALRKKREEDSQADNWDRSGDR